MSRALRALICSLACIAFAGCGAEVDSPMTLRLASALDARVRTLTVRLFAGDQSCDVIEISGPAVRGAYERSLSADGSGAATSADIGTIYPDVYTVVVWGFDEGDRPVQYGCLETPIEILNGVRADVTVELRDYAGP